MLTVYVFAVDSLRGQMHCLRSASIAAADQEQVPVE